MRADAVKSEWSYPAKALNNPARRFRRPDIGVDAVARRICRKLTQCSDFYFSCSRAPSLRYLMLQRSRRLLKVVVFSQTIALPVMVPTDVVQAHPPL
jgi:hypothetical protein